VGLVSENFISFILVLSHTEKMIVARKIESEMIDFKLTEIDWITKELNLASKRDH